MFAKQEFANQFDIWSISVFFLSRSDIADEPSVAKLMICLYPSGSIVDSHAHVVRGGEASSPSLSFFVS